jgi:replicative DNA helicase
MTANVDDLWSLPAEAAALGSILVDGQCMAQVVPILGSEGLFFEPQHQIIYSALLALYIGGVATDAVTLRDELTAQGKMEQAGGVEYIAKILGSVPSSANAGYYARIVREKARYRQAVTTAEQINKVPDETLNADEAITRIQDLALSLTVTGVEPDGLAVQIALFMARAGNSVMYFTLEMGHRALFERAICNLAQIDNQISRNKILFPGVEDKVAIAKEQLKALDFSVFEKAAAPESQLAHIRRRRKLGKVDVVFIDYLQLMDAGERTKSLYQTVTLISKKLARMAGGEHIPVIALSQLNRQPEGRTGHRPRLSDLRESGSIEQDADIVLLLHREDYYRKLENPTEKGDGAAEVIVAKNRRGPTGIAKLSFLDNQVRFSDYEYEEKGL